MEGLDWDNPSAASTLLSAIGLPSSIWKFTAHNNSHDFPTVSGCAIGDYNPHDITNNSLENTMEDRTVASDNKFFYNLELNSGTDNKYQKGELITPEKYCFKSPSRMQEQAFDHKLTVSADPRNYFLSSANNTMNATADDAVISSQIHIVNDREHSIISSNKSFRTVTCSDAIFSESAEQDEAVSQSSSHPFSKKGKSPRTTDRSFSLEGESYLFFNGYQSDFSPKGGGFKLITEDYSTKQKKPRSEKLEKSSNIKILSPNSPFLEPDTEAIATMKEMIYRAAALRPVNLGPEIIKSKRKNVKISSDPQTVAARQRRERISDRIRILQRLVPGGTKMDTATMLDEAANYLKFLKSQVALLQSVGGTTNNSTNYQQNQSPPFTIRRP